MGERAPVSLGAARAHLRGDPIPVKSRDKVGDRDPVRVDGDSALRLRDQLGALDLRLALGAGERMPAALALAGLRVVRVDHDGPMSGRTFTDVAFHGFAPVPLRKTL